MPSPSDLDQFVDTLALGSDLTQHSPSHTFKPDLSQREKTSHTTLPSLGPLPILHLGEDDAADLQITSEIGRGGMGIVSAARQRALDREVAVKRLIPDRNNPHAALQLAHEARIVAPLEHPAILPIYTLGVDAHGDPILVMKRIQGVTWTSLLDTEEHDLWNQHHTDRTAWHVETLIRVCQAVELAHAHNVLHRDIKPDNVMIGRFGEVYLVDWGLAVRIDEQTPDDRGSYPIVGTASFMPPEIVAGKPATPASDVFLLGATLHRALTGQPRHTGDTLVAVLFNAHRVQPATFPPHIPAELADIANKATARDPEDRFPSVEALRGALEAWLQHRHALAICDEADDRLLDATTWLDQHTEPATFEIRAALTNARFGYKQALRSWADNPRALDGLQRCLDADIEVELRAENLDAAQALALHLGDRRPDLFHRIRGLQLHLEARKAHLQQLETFHHAHDANVSTRYRARATLILGALWGLTGGTALVLRNLGLVTVNWISTLLITVFVSGAVGVGFFFFARRIEWNNYNKRVFGSIAVAVATMPVCRTIGFLLDANVAHVLRLELAFSVIAATLIELGFRLRIWPAILAHAVLALIGSLTGYILECYTLGLIILSLTASWHFHRLQHKPHILNK